MEGVRGEGRGARRGGVGEGGAPSKSVGVVSGRMAAAGVVGAGGRPRGAGGRFGALMLRSFTIDAPCAAVARAKRAERRDETGRTPAGSRRAKAERGAKAAHHAQPLLLRRHLAGRLRAGGRLGGPEAGARRRVRREVRRGSGRVHQRVTQPSWGVRSCAVHACAERGRGRCLRRATGSVGHRAVRARYAALEARPWRRARAGRTVHRRRRREGGSLAKRLPRRSGTGGGGGGSPGSRLRLRRGRLGGGRAVGGSERRRDDAAPVAGGAGGGLARRAGRLLQRGARGGETAREDPSHEGHRRIIVDNATDAAGSPWRRSAAQVEQVS